jgi:hypothetical protein
MSAAFSPRQWALAGLLLATLAAAFWPMDEAALGEADEVVAVVDVAERRGQGRADCPEGGCNGDVAPSPRSSPGGRGREEARFAAALTGDLFPAQSFRPPPPPPPPPQPALPPPPPMAPPLPFTFVGAWQEAGKEAVFLERGPLLLTVRVGETLPGGWRLDRFEPDGLTFTYVSLNQQRTLRIAP